ncbi:MAG: histidine kinase dimerization/phospho-acceptor domain-containing protein [Sphingomicrobium sp.]
MRFDDRLKTVLDSPVADARDRAVRWRQLVDLLSRARADGDPELINRAIQAARDDRSSVPDTVRAATARSIAGRPLDPRLVALFASDLLEVAAPVLAGATLDAAARAEVAASASEEVRRFFFALDGRGAPPPPAEADDGLLDDAVTELGEEGPIPSIGEVVARIERLRRDRAGAEAPAPVQPPVPAKPDVALFRWESDALGAIAWVEGAPRAALIGRALAGHPGEALLAEECRDLINRRAPFADMPLAAVEPFAGEWKVSGAPAFAPGDGRFIGYRGMARRTDLTPAQRAAAPRAFEGADTLREMIHEIKTPLNAIIGFAEIIDGQYLGPAHRRYRDRAGEILGQARNLLAAIEDLDFAAKLQSSRSQPGQGTDFAEIFPRMAEELNAYGAERRVGVLYKLTGKFARCALDPALSERLVRRFVASIIDNSGAGESLSIDVGAVSGMCAVAVVRPSTLRDTTADELFDPAFTGPGDEQIGLGFAFRLMRGLARIAGGDLRVDADRFTLLVPPAR